MLPTDTSTSTGAASLVSYDREADRAAVRIQRRRDTLEAFAAVIVTIVIALAICFVMLLAVGKDPVEAYHWLLTGPFSRTTRLGQVIVLTTTLTILGLDFAAMLANAFLVERVFVWPGLSRYGVEVILRKDLDAIVGVVLVIAAMFLITNLIVDVIVSIINPRIRLAERKAKA